MKAPRSGGLLGNLAKRLKDCDVYLAYPGLRLRDDVYATHGHYLDLHMTIPTLECDLRGRSCAASPAAAARAAPPADYEAIVAPMYALLNGPRRGRRSDRGAGAAAALAQRLAARQRPDWPLGRFAIGRLAIPGGVRRSTGLGFGPARARPRRGSGGASTRPERARVAR